VVEASSAPPLVMGVVNVTPDSFSDGGQHLAVDRAVAAALRMVRDGASVIDVGGESTRPGADPVDPLEEQRRVVPVLESLAEPCGAAGVRLSIDTRHESTARRAVAVGATLINDVSAGLAPVAADEQVGWVAMHMSGTPATMQAEPHYDDVVGEVAAFLSERIEWARSLGVPEVWVDPGIGFGKTTAHNVALLAATPRLAELGAPLVVGTSRKRSLGVLLARSDGRLPAHPGPCGGTAEFEPPSVGLRPLDVGNRLAGSLISAGWAMIHGARMVRVHDVAETARLVQMLVAGELGSTSS
jgi:dihydropteroate synthase